MLIFSIVDKEGLGNTDFEIQRMDWEGPIHDTATAHPEDIRLTHLTDSAFTDQTESHDKNHGFDSRAEEIWEGEGGPPRPMQ